MKYIYTFVLLSIIGNSFAQNDEKIIINNSTYDDWKSLKNESWTPSGRIVKYEINPAKGDGYLYFISADSNKIDSIYKGTNAKLHYKDQFATFIIKPGFDTIRTLKLAKTKKDKMPKDTLGIIWFKNDSLITIPMINSYQLAKEGDWMAYLNHKDLRPNCPTYKKWQWFKKRQKCERTKTSGKTLTVFNPLSGKKEIIHRVTEYKFNKNGTLMTYTLSHKGEKDTLQLMVYDLKNNSHINLAQYKFSIKNIIFHEEINQLAFLSSSDTNKIKTFVLNFWSENQGGNAKTIVDSTSSGLISNWTVSEHGRISFSKNGEIIYFGSNLIVEQEAEDTLLRTEKAKVDVWSWTDKRVQPQQLLSVNRDKNKSYLTTYSLPNKSIVHLENNSFESVNINYRTNAEYALYVDKEKYQKSYSWAFPWPSDYGLIDLKSGEKQNYLENIGYNPTLSPSTQFIVWYNGKDSTWHGLNTKSKQDANLTELIDDSFYNDNNGSPYNPFPERALGWIKNHGKEKLIVSSENDIWLLDPANQEPPLCLTKGIGKANNIKYSLTNFTRDSAYLYLDKIILKGVDNITKNEFFTDFKQIKKTNYIDGGHKFYYIAKAKNSERYFYRKMNVSNYPELYTSTSDFSNTKKLSTTNPEQKNYNWTTVEQVKWKSYKGLDLDGLLYKPENFDSTKVYPMIVYFYEKYDDNLHSYYSPKPTASIVYPTEYASNGYIVFIPNILYTPGHPAQSAYDCILSGTDNLTSKYNWIDSNKLGLQGQSWGGYQTAQLVTMTNKYACGMAGAPVSNMFSAYGGIRWGSGMSRMFQYERTQSRIGCTIWECPELYIENSPIFGLPKVETPLLIMHNDNDGAVPWYQGIEMFMGLRRLEKPVWMLNYNGDNHNLRQTANKEDLSIRMRQFFDYYLKDEAMPIWMKNGIPATEKGNLEYFNLDNQE